MKNIRFTVLALLSLLSFGVTEAVPADPSPKTVRQPDGSLLTVVIRGDERSHLIRTSDGIPLYFDRAKKAFEYARLDGGKITGSGIMAHDVSDRDAKSAEYVNTMDVAGICRAAFNRTNLPVLKSPGPQRILINDFPTKGRQKSLVILLSFSDKDFASVEDPKQFYSDMLNREGFTWSNGANGSVRDFYLKSSSGQFDPDFVVAGPVKLSKESTYYGSDDGGQDNNMGEAIVEACQALDEEIDFSEFDTNGDGQVDNIYFFYAGGGQADDPNGTDYIWPHAYNLEGWGKTLELDGVKISRYACSNELRYNRNGELIPAGIGTFVHEFGHVLGLADHYDVSYGMFTFGLGAWDTMASGSYNDNMNTPPLFSGFERGELGWLEYKDLTLSADSISILPYLGESNMAYRVKVLDSENEFYVLENRQKQGFDKFLPGHGILVWHIDIDTTAWMNNAVNVQPNHQRVDIVEADGTTDEASRAGDIFPGTSGVTQAALKSWAGNELVSIDDVAERNDTIRLLLKGTKFRLPSPSEVKALDVADSSFVFTWSKVSDARLYTADIYSMDENGDKSFVQGFKNTTYMSADTLRVEGLLPETVYYVDIAAGLGSYVSDKAKAEVETKELAFEKRFPTGLSVSDVSPSGFKGTWEEVPGATDYAVTLYRHEYGKETKEMGYDFTDKYDGLPELWSSNSNTYYSVDGYYGAASPSLRLSSDGSYLVVAYLEAKINNVSFWCRSNKDGNKVHVEAADADGWKELETVTVTADGTVVSVDTKGAERVRLRLERAGGFVVIDDVVASCHVIERSVVSGYEDVTTSGTTSMSFDNLVSGDTYSFKARGVSNGIKSHVSDECKVTLPGTTGLQNVEKPDSGKTEIYDMYGRKMKVGKVHGGVYIIKKDGKAFKVLKK